MKKLIIVVDSAAFEMFEAGLETEEYRAITPYWWSRLVECGEIHKMDSYDEQEIELLPVAEWKMLKEKRFSSVEFRKGYTKTAIQFEYLGTEIGLPNPEYIPKSIIKYKPNPNKEEFIILRVKYGFCPSEEVFKIKLGKRL